MQSSSLRLLLAGIAAFLSCSVSADGSANIIGGEEAPPFHYSDWMLGMLHPRLLNGSHPFCGAVYIGMNLVLTAAHCIRDTRVRADGKLWVEGKRHNWRDPQERGERMTVTNITVHPDYNSRTLESDIAVLTVDSGPELPLYPFLDDGKWSDESEPRLFKVIGWGDTQDGAEAPSPVLLQAEVEMLPSAACQEAFLSSAFSLFPDTMVCALRPGADACEKDSGGPMFVHTTPPIIVGLVSWSLGCNRGFPGVYTRVSSLRSFIDEVVGCSVGTTFTRGTCVPKAAAERGYHQQRLV